jgi:hypothetical protein
MSSSAVTEISLATVSDSILFLHSCLYLTSIPIIDSFNYKSMTILFDWDRSKHCFSQHYVADGLIQDPRATATPIRKIKMNWLQVAYPLP